MEHLWLTPTYKMKINCRTTHRTVTTTQSQRTLTQQAIRHNRRLLMLLERNESLQVKMIAAFRRVQHIPTTTPATFRMTAPSLNENDDEERSDRGLLLRPSVKTTMTMMMVAATETTTTMMTKVLFPILN